MEPNPYEAPKCALPPRTGQRNALGFYSRKLVVAVACMIGLMTLVSIVVYATIAVAAVIGLSGR
jgi:hypothetical protein